jgi:hypothetical protein
MNLATEETRLLEAVRAEDLQSYLLGKGWVRKPFARPQALLFEGPPDDDGEPITQLVPANEQLRDYPLRVEEILRALSAVEGRPALDILWEVRTPDCDRVLFRLQGPGTADGSIEFDRAPQFLGAVRQLLLLVAKGVLGPRPLNGPAHAEVPCAPVQPERWRLRPHSGGGFGLTVEVPLPPSSGGNAGLPLQRQITAALQGQLAALEAALAGDSRPLRDQEPPSASADLCEALLALLLCAPEPDSVLEVGLTWARTWPAAPPGRQAFVFPTADAGRLEQLRREPLRTPDAGTPAQ